MTLKHVFCLALTTLSFSLVAREGDSLEEAARLYSLRGEARGTDSAQASADMYGRLAAMVSSLDTQAELKNRQSEALYWVGTHASNTQESIAKHKEGYEVSLSVIALEGQISAEKLAEANYFYGANLGKWGEPQSAVVKAQNWPKLKAAMEKILVLKQQATQDYGVHRILGRAYFKLPWPLGSNSDSLEHLRLAVNATRAVVNGVEQSFSRHGTNNTFLAETLIAIGGDEELTEAEEILKGYLAADLDTLYPERVPENKEEVAVAKKLLESI